MSKTAFFDLWLASFVALSAVYDDPMMEILSLVSAVLRVIGNGYLLYRIIGGRLMKIRNNIVEKLTKSAETLLIVGNMGEFIIPAVKQWGMGMFPSKNPVINICPSHHSSLARRDFCL